MKLLFWLLALFGAAVALALAANNPGYVLIVYPPYRIEFSLTLFVLGLLTTLALTYLAIRLTLAVLNLPGKVRAYREQRALSKGRAAMTEALTAFFEGRYAVAEKAAVRAMESGDKSGINPIIAARSAHELREFDKRDSYLANAEGKSVGEATMRLIAKTEFMLDQKQPQMALNTLKELSETGQHKHLRALQLELKAQQQARNWDGVLAAVTQLEKRAAINETLASQLRQQSWLEKLRNQSQDAAGLLSLWKSIPDDLKRNSKIAALAASSFIQHKDCKTAQRLLTESLNTKWDSELVTLFGDCKGPNNIGQIEQAENWLKSHSDDAGLLLALGKLCLHHGLWGKAQNYLDASVSLAPNPTAFNALAELAEKLEKPELAVQYMQKAQQSTNK